MDDIDNTPYRFYVEQRPDPAFYRELILWLKASCVDTWWWDGTSLNIICFKNMGDATMFKLKYTGIHDYMYN